MTSHIHRLNIEQTKKQEYKDSLRSKHSNVFDVAYAYVSTGGLHRFIFPGGMALLYWWGGFLLSTYHTWKFLDFLIAYLVLLCSVAGLIPVLKDTTDRKVAKEAAVRVFSLIDRESKIDPGDSLCNDLRDKAANGGGEGGWESC